MDDIDKVLQEYIRGSELRIVNDNFRMRMSPELAEKYDAGIYRELVYDHATCIGELTKVLGGVFDEKHIFYTYLIPDNMVEKILGVSGGHPIQCFDKDGFSLAYGSPQDFFILKDKISIPEHVNFIHEYAHLVQEQFGQSKHRLFREGFAEVVPWYVLDYESKYPEHAQMVAETEIYSVNDLLTKIDMNEYDKPKRRCSFQKTYISSYVFVRTILEKMVAKFSITKEDATKLYLSIYAISPNTNQDKLDPNSEGSKEWLVARIQDSYVLLGAFAKMLDLDLDKLFYTTEYQKEVLQKLKKNSRMNQEIETSNLYGGIKR